MMQPGTGDLLTSMDLLPAESTSFPEAISGELRWAQKWVWLVHFESR